MRTTTLTSRRRESSIRSLVSSPFGRAIGAVAAGSVLTFFACQVYLAIKVPMIARVSVLAAIVVIGVAGIVALLQNEEEVAPPTERLYTAAEVREILEAVRAGRFTLPSDDACKFCNGAGPEAIGVDGLRYHRRCFQEAFAIGKT